MDPTRRISEILKRTNLYELYQTIYMITVILASLISHLMQLDFIDPIFAELLIKNGYCYHTVIFHKISSFDVITM